MRLIHQNYTATKRKKTTKDRQRGTRNAQSHGESDSARFDVPHRSNAFHFCCCWVVITM